MVKANLVKAYLKSKEMRCSKELAAALDLELAKLLDAASLKALKDKRKTVTPADLVN